jgi:hypothetical protein
MMLAIRATRTIDEARRQGYDGSLLPYVLEDLGLLLKNELSPRRQRRTGRLVTFVEGWLKRKADAAEAGAPPSPAPRLHSSARDVLAGERRHVSGMKSPCHDDVLSSGNLPAHVEVRG